MNAQINHSNVTSYGATEHVVGNPFAPQPAAYPTQASVDYPQQQQQQVSQSNPFANPSMIAEQPPQMYPNLHGTTDQGDFNQY